MIITAIAANSQITYTTAQSGSYSIAGTWVGAQAPPTSGNCNCRIVVKSGHQLTLNVNMTINNTTLILDGPNSIVTFLNNIDVTFGGTSSIDIQDVGARIVRGNPQNNITLGTTVIYDGATTRNPADAPFGTVNGLASASTLRASPQFQSGTLPVKLAEFIVSGKGTQVALSWKTELEINSSHFDIERSTDSKQWSSIGTVQASGNVSVEKSYSFTDAAPANGINYYRLKIVDIDAKFEYSPIKTVSFTATALNVIAGPNPAYSFLNINVSAPGSDPYRLRLINRSGQVVFDQKYAASTTRLQLSVSNYADGTYFLEVTNGSGLRQINKVMIVRK